jgi:hypothetical protein
MAVVREELATQMRVDEQEQIRRAQQNGESLTPANDPS